MNSVVLAEGFTVLRKPFERRVVPVIMDKSSIGFALLSDNSGRLSIREPCLEELT